MAGLGHLGQTMLQRGSPAGLRAASTEKAFHAKMVVLCESGGNPGRPVGQRLEKEGFKIPKKDFVLPKIGVSRRRDETSTIRQRSGRSRARLSPGEGLGLVLEKYEFTR